MNENDKALMQQLLDLMPNPAYFEFESHSVVEDMKKSEDPSIFVEPIFRMMEAAPLYNFGNPGSLVHFIEATDGYETKLIESLQRTPSMHGLIILNRILSRFELKNRREYMNVLKDIIGRPDTKPEIVKEANNKLNRQMERTQK